MEELISIQKYASLNRLSTHAVIKKTMNGELQTVVKEENGKEVTYILNPKTEKKVIEAPLVEKASDEECAIDYQKAYKDLNKEFLILKTKYEKLLSAQS
ncbi:MAG: hypothetical protein Q8J85_08440 [Sulfuricurvum sp.]|nr:hypothetical protein [Sulfuricurvum sp.]MDP3023642.1 hypothetical protein [Sulfuricurvum sp.]